jgi:hypothetical protein
MATILAQHPLNEQVYANHNLQITGGNMLNKAPTPIPYHHLQRFTTLFCKTVYKTLYKIPPTYPPYVGGGHGVGGGEWIL